MAKKKSLLERCLDDLEKIDGITADLLLQEIKDLKPLEDKAILHAIGSYTKAMDPSQLGLICADPEFPRHPIGENPREFTSVEDLFNISQWVGSPRSTYHALLSLSSMVLAVRLYDRLVTSQKSVA